MEKLMPMPYNEKIGEKDRMILSAFILAHICKSFSNAKGACTPLQLKMATGVPTHIVAELIDCLAQAKLVINVGGGDKDKEPAFMPGEDIANITIGEMVDRLDNTGSWPLENTDIEAIIKNNPNWGGAMAIRQRYIDELRTMKVIALETS